MCSPRTPKRLPLSFFSLGLASSPAAIPGQPLLCPRGEGVRSLRSRPLVATALTVQTTSIACYWIQAKHMPSGGYGLSIHRYPILRRGIHDPVITVYVKVKAACFTSPSRAQPDLLSFEPSSRPGLGWLGTGHPLNWWFVDLAQLFLQGFPTLCWGFRGFG